LPESEHIQADQQRTWVVSASVGFPFALQWPRQQSSNGGIAVVSPDWGNGEILVMGFNRWQVFKTLATIVGIVAIVSLALIHFIPAPPSKVVMATAFKGASFDHYGRRYREVFARYNVDLELRETAGAVENVKLLQDPNSGVQIGFVTGGVSDAKRAPDVLSLGTAYNQPFWIFYSSNQQLDQLILPQGVVDIDKNIPPVDIQLIGTTSKILIRNDLHPEIVQLLLQTMKEVHSGSDIFHRNGEYPNGTDAEYTSRRPLSISTRTVLRSCNGICPCGCRSTCKGRSRCW
jgi:hypothetical protein